MRSLALIVTTVFTALSSFAALASPHVIGFERFHREEASIAAGNLLLGELNCTSCHAPTSEEDLKIFTRTPPDIIGAARRIQPDALKQWLANPHATKPGTVMPDMLAGKSDEQRDQIALELAAYLTTLAATSSKAFPELASRNVEHGKTLYESVGCVACHGTRDGGEASAKANSSLLALPDLSRKYTPGSLAAFLMDPLRVRPSGRMPHVPLTPEEAGDLTAYLMGDQGSSASITLTPGGPDFRAGRQQFQILGCANCHSMSSSNLRTSGWIKAPNLSSLAKNPDGGCLAAKPGTKVPHYGLDAHQRKAIAAALQALAQDLPPDIWNQVTDQRLTALNCLQCHNRDGRGGPLKRLNGHFHSTGEDLGDEGRLPPTLTGVGRKLLPEAMVKIITGNGTIRPYMSTRMPDFGENHAKAFSGLFGEVDADPKEEPTPRHGDENKVGRNMWGRELMGTKGLSCITCHDLNGHKSLGIRAVDLAHAPGRLRPAWFRDYLIDPNKFRPGTRMPSFWPEGKAIFPLIGKNTSRQIDSIWVYLNEVDQTRLPEGMEKTDKYVLHPKDRPIVFRTFMDGAGMHAIAVGFPEGVHAAFDSRNLRWALGWKGAFLDAESTWEDRFTPLATPLGDSVVHLGIGFDSMPALPGQGFKGYRLNNAGIPTFLYELGGSSFQDTVAPTAGGLSRTLVWEAGPQQEVSVTFQSSQDWRLQLVQIEGGEGSLKDGKWTLRRSGQGQVTATWHLLW